MEMVPGQGDALAGESCSSYHRWIRNLVSQAPMWRLQSWCLDFLDILYIPNMSACLPHRSTQYNISFQSARTHISFHMLSRRRHCFAKGTSTLVTSGVLSADLVSTRSVSMRCILCKCQENHPCEDLGRSHLSSMCFIRVCLLELQ